MADITVTQYNTGIVVNATLKRNGSAIDLTGADAVSFAARKRYLKINRPCSIVDAAAGKVRFTFGADDINEAGTFDAQFEIAIGADREAVPNDRYLTLVILSALV